MKLKFSAKTKFLIKAVSRTCVVMRLKHTANFVKEYKRMVTTCLWLEKGTREYIARKMYMMSDEEIQQIYENEVHESIVRREWKLNWRRRLKMLNRYSSMEYDTTRAKTHEKRAMYEKEFGIPQDCTIQYGVIITSAHFREGKFSVGHKVVFARDISLNKFLSPTLFLTRILI